MLHQPLQETELLVALTHQRVTQLMRDRQRPARTNRIDEQRLRTVERIDIADAPSQRRRIRPASGLHGPRDLEREFIKVPLPRILRQAAFIHQPPQIPIGAHIIKTVIVDPHVRQMRGHHLHGPPPTKFQELLSARGVELQNRRAILKTLRPFGPPFGRILSRDGEDRRSRTGGTTLFNRAKTISRYRPKDFQSRQQIRRPQFFVDFNHKTQATRR